MTKDEQIYDFMIDIAWKGIDDIQETIDKIEEKAINVITFSGILMGIEGGISVGFENIHSLAKSFIVLDLLLLLFCVIYAFKTIWLEKQDVLDIQEAYNNLDWTDICQAKGNFAFSIGKWQDRAKKSAKKKSHYLKISMLLFIAALIFLIPTTMVTFYQDAVYKLVTIFF